MNADEVKKIVSDSLNELNDSQLKRKLQLCSVEPIEKIIDHYDSSGSVTSCRIWVVFDLVERDVVLLYSSEGYSLEGYSWGIGFRESDNTGPPSCWYKGLEACALDSGYFELGDR